MSDPNSIIKTIKVQPTVAEAVYHANDCIGGKQTLTDVLRADNGGVFLYGVFLTDAANVKPVLEIVLFGSNPTAATLTDHAAIAFSTDISKVVARIPVAATDWATVGGIAIADVLWPRALEVETGNKLYAAIMAVGAPDFVATTDLVLQFKFNR